MAWLRLGCREDPFGAGFDKRFVYADPGQLHFFEQLRQTIVAEGGLALITGQGGTGKTTLLHGLVTDLRESIPLIFFFATPVPTIEALIDGCCTQSEIDCPARLEGKDPLAACQELLAGIEPERHRVLIVDEAQSLTDEMLDCLLELAAMRHGGKCLLPVVLAGQPQLEGRLMDGRLGAKAEIVGLRYRTAPLAATEIESFIRHRLRAAGCTAGNPFSEEAMERIALYSNGIQGRIKSLCSLALFFAAEQDAPQVTAAAVELAASATLLDENQASGASQPARAQPGEDGQRGPTAIPEVPPLRPPVPLAARATTAAQGPSSSATPARRKGWAWSLALLATIMAAIGIAWMLLDPHRGQSPAAGTSHPMQADDTSAEHAPPLRRTDSTEVQMGAYADARAPRADRPAGKGDAESVVETEASSPSEVQLLLAAAAAHVDADRLVAPPFDNALAIYRKVLRLDPGNDAALSGLDAIKTKLMDYARAEAARGDLASARRQLQKIRLIDDEDPADIGLARQRLTGEGR